MDRTLSKWSLQWVVMKDKMVSNKSNLSESNEEEGSDESNEEAESDVEMGGKDSNNEEVNGSDTD